MIDITGSKSAQPSTVEQSLQRLERIFAGGWRDDFGEIGNEIASLRDGRSLLRHFINVHARNLTWPALSGTQSFTIYNGASFYVRINIWMPYVKNMTDSYRKYLSIDVIHNHHFDFFTTCLHGPGYSSTFWRDDSHGPERQMGELVNLTREIRVSLSGQNIWFVERGADYHSQHWPDDFSVTLNVIPKERDDTAAVQYVLDDGGRVASIIASARQGSPAQ